MAKSTLTITLNDDLTIGMHGEIDNTPLVALMLGGALNALANHLATKSGQGSGLIVAGHNVNIRGLRAPDVK